MARRDSVANTARDPLVEFADLKIDGETYHLIYDFNAIAEAEKIAGCNLLQGIAAVIMMGMTAGQVRGLLYAATRKAHPKLTIEQCGRLVRLDTLPEIVEALKVSYNNSLPRKPLADPPEGAAVAPEQDLPMDNFGS